MVPNYLQSLKISENLNQKQDYTILIRQKEYYTSEDYKRVFQINTFSSINTNHSVAGVGNASIRVKMGEKITKAEQGADGVTENDKNTVFSAGWGKDANGNYNSQLAFEQLVRGWNNSDFRYRIEVREQKYEQLNIEEADIKPMDEVYIFSKSMNENAKYGDLRQYDYIQIFFGYVTSITRTYDTSLGYTMNISCEDQSKKMKYSRISMRGAIDSNVEGHETYVENGVTKLRSGPDDNVFTNLFAGQKLDQFFVDKLLINSGVDKSFTTKRIEKIDRVPFLVYFKDNFYDLFRAEFDTRLAFAKKAATYLNIEFFFDEEGQAVLKAPTYDIGINSRLENNMGYPGGGTDGGIFKPTNASWAGNNFLKNDDKIPTLDDKIIINSSFTESDSEIFTSVQVTATRDFYNMEDIFVKVKVENEEWIKQFGYREMQPTVTPLTKDIMGARKYGDMLLYRAYAKRHTASVLAIEEPTIRIGNLIKINSGIDNTNSQYNHKIPTIYYIEAISRSIQPDRVSTMNITLSAGRKLNEPSLFEKVPELWSYFKEREGSIYEDNTKYYDVYNSSSTGSSSGSLSSSGYGSSEDHYGFYKAYVKEYGRDPSPYAFIPLNIKCPLSTSNLNDLINKHISNKGNPSMIASESRNFYDAGNKYNINPFFLIALAIQESAAGTSDLARDHLNIFSFRATNQNTRNNSEGGMFTLFNKYGDKQPLPEGFFNLKPQERKNTYFAPMVRSFCDFLNTRYINREGPIPHSLWNFIFWEKGNRYAVHNNGDPNMKWIHGITLIMENFVKFDDYLNKTPELKKYGSNSKEVTNYFINKMLNTSSGQPLGKIKVQNLEWFGNLQNKFEGGKTKFVIYDANNPTINWNARCTAAAGHCDWKPITSDDREKMIKAFRRENMNQGTKVSSWQSYNPEATWAKKGVVVKMNINGMDTYVAGSIHGMPHTVGKEPDFNNGHYCLHFKNSKTNLTDKIDNDHQYCINWVVEKYKASNLNISGSIE